MRDDTVTGTEEAILRLRSRAEIDAWVTRALRELTGAAPVRWLFRAGRIDAVYAVETEDGRRLVLKVHRPPVDLDARRAIAEAQRALARAGFPCPEPVAGPTLLNGRTVTVETLLESGDTQTGGDPVVRAATAAGLAEQMRILRAVPALEHAVGDPPAWCRYQSGPWPVPHDPVFDFTSTPPGYEWLDDIARRASEILVRDLAREGREVVVGHADWYCGNLRFDDGRLCAAFDWDLVADSAPVLAGLSAGGYRTDRTPTPGDVAAFLADFETAWTHPFTDAERSTAFAAATWMIAFNARCDLDNLRRCIDDGTALRALQEHGEKYLEQLT